MERKVFVIRFKVNQIIGKRKNSTQKKWRFCRESRRPWWGGGGERVCGLADLAKNFLRIADFNNNFSGSADPIDLMDSALGKNRVWITDSKHNSNEPVIEPSITFLSEHLSRCLYCTTLELEHSNVLILRVHSRAKL